MVVHIRNMDNPPTTAVAVQQVWVALGPVSTLRPRQNGRHFADDIFKCIFMNENV